MLSCVDLTNSGSLREAPTVLDRTGPLRELSSGFAGEVAGVPLNPLASTKGCKLLILRCVTIIVIRLIAYNLLNVSLLELL